MPTRAALLAVFFTAAAFAQDQRELWQDLREVDAVATRTTAKSMRTVEPRVGRALRLDRAALAKALSRAPVEGEESDTPLEIALPMPDGTFLRFTIEESLVMDARLAKKFPQLKSYLGRGIDAPEASARIDLTPRGLHAIVLDGVATTYIDPYWRDSDATYVSYRKRDFTKAGKPMNCLVPGREGFIPQLVPRALAARPTGAQLRTYRTAVACTGEYAAAAGGGTVLGSLGAILTTVNRVSAIYERDLSIRLRLVANNDAIIFTNAATDGFTDNDPDLLIDESQAKIDSVIGNANYDLGHTFSTGGGGLAGLGVVGVTGQKASGITGSGNPVGDPYDVDYVAHEMGHQFGGNHPFNGTTGACTGGNRNGPTAYEPGSGTTIMAYAGICSPQDLQGNSDDYFHTISYDEIDAITSVAPGNVGVSTPTGNTPPIIGALTNFTIPNQTPFALTASATDPDGDVLTYCWEQFNLGAAQDPTANPRDNGSSPIFRSFDPTRSPTRVFPSLGFILNNANVPPATLSGFATGEFLPTTNRTMTFRVTVRDNRAGGGGSNYGSMTVTSTTSAGPFAITAPNSAATLTGGSNVAVTWNVANTTAAPVSCANVKISLSTDGGQTFPFVLAASTPNDGSESVTLPSVANVATTQGRIKVEAVGNIFFDLSAANLTITSTTAAPELTMGGNVTLRRGTPTATTTTVATVNDSNTPLTASILNAPADTTITAAIIGTNVQVTALADCSIVTTLTTRSYPVTLVVADALGSTSSGTFNLVVQPNLTPTVGTFANTLVSPNSSATVTPSAAPADSNGNLGVAPMSVAPTTLAGGGTVTVNQTTGAVTANTVAGTTLGARTIRVFATDTCGATTVREFTLTIANSGPLIVAGTASAPTAENCVPANAAPDPAETVTINFPLNNTGLAATANLVATMQSSASVTPGLGGPQNYGSIPPSGSVTRPFTFTVSGSAACGSLVNVVFALQDGASNLGTATFPIRLGVFQPAGPNVQNFDGVTAPALPTGWTATVAQGSAPAWTTNTTTPDTAPNSASSSTVVTVADTRLDSANIAIISNAAQISFRHRWLLEDTYDGGVLEISIGGGAFADILAAGGSFVTGGYTDTISSGFASPIAGRQAWSGSANSAYTTTTVNLPASAAGQNIKLRWRLACDNDVTEAGSVWRIDTITLSDGSYACCGQSPAFTSALPASGIAGAAYSHTFVVSGTPPSGFAFTAGAPPSGLALTGANLAGTPTTPGVYAGLQVTAANGLLPNAAQSFTLTINDSLAHYLGTFGLNGGNAAPAFDFDGDGLNGVLEYGLALSPTTPNAGALPQPIVKNYAGTNYLSLTFTRQVFATDLTYVVQATGDFATWSDVATSAGGAVTSGPGFVSETGSGATRSVEVRDIVPANGQRFLRLQITGP